jgi:hypothetical protein
MADSTRGSGLQTIFSFFLGLMVTAFIGVGVYTFYPSPQQQSNDRIRQLRREETAIRANRPLTDITPEERARMQVLTDSINALTDAGRVEIRAWGRTTSVVLIAFATLAMAVSLLRGAQLPVIANGLLLGGVFTMVYGVGWIIATDTSVVRFLVMTAALAITLSLGYARFVRGRANAAAPGPAGPSDGAALNDIDRRVRDIEARLQSVATALGQSSAGGPPSS